ncbi:MAG: hypothetical protein ACNA7Q_12090 [Rhodobacterales bacterium]
MAITYPLPWPALPVSEINLVMVTTSALSESPFTGHQQVHEWPRQYWRADITLPKMRRAKAEAWFCFLASLRGRAGTFLMPPAVGHVPRGSLSVPPLVDGAGQSGLVLNVRGLPVSSQWLLLHGDYLQLGSGAGARLHKVLYDVHSDATGRAGLEIWPPLRSAPADGATIIIDNPVGRFRLLSNENAIAWSSPQRASIGFGVVEAL